MGIRNAMPTDRQVFDFYVQTLRRLSPDATFTGAGIGRDALTVARWSLEAGGHVHTGMEDNVQLVHDAGREVASPRVARQLLGLAG